MRIGLLSLFLVCCAIVGLGAQGHDLSGTWSLQAEAASGTGADGNGWNTNAVKGTLVLEQSDDALKGTWTGPSGKPWSLTGSVQDGKFEVITEPRLLTVTINDQPATMNARWVFRGAASGDTMSGAVKLSSDNDTADRFQPFTASRR